MSTSPGVLTSVIIPAYNATATLADTVASVRRQRAGQLEIVIVDDGSTDGTATLVRELGEDIRYIHQSNAGAAAARNTGLAGATGQLIAFLDADDEWPDDSLALRLAALAQHPDWSLVQGRTLAIRADRGPMSPAASHGDPWVGPLLGSALIRRPVFEQVGLFDSALQPAEDLDWFVRAREQQVVMGELDEVVLHYRLHGSSLTRGLDPVSKKLLLTLKRSLDRRRAAGSPSGGRP